MPIVAAADQSERAEQVLDEAQKLSTALDTELHVLHVVDFSVGNLVSGSTEEKNGIEDAKAEAQANAEEIASRVDLDDDREIVGLAGNPADKIIQYSEKIDADYIVMSGRKKSPTGKALFGSVLQSVLLDATCHVVSVRRR